MQYSISTAITTILFASTLTTAIPVVQKPANSTDTKATVQFTGAHEKAIQDDILANGKPQAVSNDVQGVTDAEVLIANGLNNVKCLAFDSQGTQISNAFALNRKASLGGPAQKKGGVDVGKVLCSTSGIATAPSGSSSGIPRPTPLGTMSEHLSKRAIAASSSAAAGPTGAPGNKDSGKKSNSGFDAPTATSDSSSGSPTNPAANKDNGPADKNGGASGSKAGEQGPEMTSMPAMSHNGTKSSGAGMDDGNGDAPLVRLAFSGLSELERQQAIPADSANHDIRGAVNITEVSIMDAHGQSGVKCQAFGYNGRLAAFSGKKKAQFNQNHGVNIKKVACNVDGDASAFASPSASASGTNPGGPIITDPIEPRPTPIPEASGTPKGKSDSIETAPGPEATGPFASGKGKHAGDSSSSIISGPGPEKTGAFATGMGKDSSSSSSSIMSGHGPEKTGPFKSMGAMTTLNTMIMDGGNAKPTPSS